MNLGNQEIENKQVNSFSISILGMSTVFCCLNVCLLWVDLAIETRSPGNLQKSKRVLGTIGLSYVLLFAGSYIITKQVIWWFVLGLIYTLVVIVLLRTGSVRISATLKAVTSQNAGEQARLPSLGCIHIKSKDTLHSRGEQKSADDRSLEFQRAPKIYPTNTNQAASQNKVGMQALESRSLQHIHRIQKSASLLSAVWALYFCASIAFVVTLFFPQVGGFTCICAFTMIFSLFLVRILVVEYVSGPKNAFTRILAIYCELASRFGIC